MPKTIYVNVIETRDPSIYDGDRITVFPTWEESRADILEFVNEELDTDHACLEDAIEAYQNSGKRCKLEECTL